MEQLKKHKKELILFAIVFVIALTMCGAFLQPHYTHDTYRIVYDMGMLTMHKTGF